MQEVQVHALCADVQVQSRARSMPQGDASLYGRLLLRRLVLHVGIQLDGLWPGSPIDVHIHVAHAGIVEGEVMHLQESVGLGLAHQAAPIHTARSQTVEIHGVEVDHIE